MVELASALDPLAATGAGHRAPTGVEAAATRIRELNLGWLNPARVAAVRVGAWGGPTEKLIVNLPEGLRPESRTILPAVAPEMALVAGSRFCQTAG